MKGAPLKIFTPANTDVEKLEYVPAPYPSCCQIQTCIVMIACGMWHVAYDPLAIVLYRW